MRAIYVLLLCAITVVMAVAPSAAVEEGFAPLFDGKTLKGWQLLNGAGKGYVVRDGLLVCPSDGGGVLLTNRQYSDFVLRFEFRLDKAGNNGVAIRAPRGSNAAYEGMEVQILDDSDPSYANLEPGQYCGSIYKVAPAKRGAVKKPGEWNTEEITARGRRITIRINGKTVVDANLNNVTDPAVIAEHPGMFRARGYLGFMGHGPSEVAFRNIRIRDLSVPAKLNTPPAGFAAMFNGKDLRGWKGLVANPPERRKMDSARLGAEQSAADAVTNEHWTVVDGILCYDGKGDSLCSGRDYGDFEMLVDWKIEPEGDSGIYLRGSPQVQIWDDPVGSGGLYNNQKNPSKPSKKADNPPGQWNTFRIVMVGEKVHVFLNNELVVQNVTMENYWERDKPIYPVEQIELQHHNSKLWFKNIHIRDIKAPK